MNLDDIDVAAFEKELDNDTSSVGSSGASIGHSQLPVGEYTNGVAMSSRIQNIFDGEFVVLRFLCALVVFSIILRRDFFLH